MSGLPTTVFRTSKTKAARFVSLDNAVVQDPRLSFRARGLLAYVLSKPTTWEHSAESLSAASTEGVEAVRSALRELEGLGFAEFKKLRIDGGRFKSVRLFRESPDNDLPDPEKPDPVNPSPVQPDPVKPTPGKTESGPAEPGKSRLSENTDSENTVSEITVRTERTESEEGFPSITFPASLDTPAFRAAWADWLAYRSETKLKAWKPVTIIAKLNELAAWGEPAAIVSIRQSISNGWQGIFGPKNASAGSRPGPRPLSTDMTHEQLTKRHGGTF